MSGADVAALKETTSSREEVSTFRFYQICNWCGFELIPDPSTLAPKPGKFVDDPDKHALLRFYDVLDDDQRRQIFALLRAMAPGAVAPEAAQFDDNSHMPASNNPEITTT